MQCLSCGGEISPSAARCPHCGARRRPRLAGADRWERAPLRTRATIVGLLIAATIVLAAGYLIATHPRHDPDVPSIILEGGR